MDSEEILNNIKIDSEAVLTDENQMKEVINDPKLAVALLDAKNIDNLVVTVENEEVTLINNTKPKNLKNLTDTFKK